MKKNQKVIKNIIAINTIPQPLSRPNDIKIYKKNNINDSSSHSLSNIPSNKQFLENTFKDSLEGSISESKTNILIPDSLNNTKSSIGNANHKKMNKNKITNQNDKNNNNINGEKSENEEINSMGGNINEENTKKIDYRFYTNYPVFMINNTINTVKNKEKNRYWLAVYDKLMKKKNILKILNYYEKLDRKNDNNQKLNIDINKDYIKEQLLIIKDFDIYFMKQSNKPFIKYIKGNCIFAKLYLLTIEEINLILNYINRYKLSLSSFSIRSLQKKGNFQKLNERYIKFPYNMIYHMGSYMNINIYGFSNFNLLDNNNINYNYLNQKFPCSRKIAKLIKLLMINFPKYSFNFFICYLLSKIRFENFNEKTNEIKNIVYSSNKSFMPLNNRFFNNNIINNSIMHSSYSPLSHYDEDTSNDKPIIKNYTENNYQQLIGENMNFEYNTIDNYNNKYYNNKKKNNFINNKNEIIKNNSEKKRAFKKHTESVYLNGYIGKDNKLLFNKEKTKDKKEEQNSIKQIFNGIKLRPSLVINEKYKNKKKTAHNNNPNNNKSFSQNNKINFPNFVHVKKKNTNYFENGIYKRKQKYLMNLENEENNNNLIEEIKDKNKSNNNQKTSKIIFNTKSEETKIGTTNKEITNINNSLKDDINKENTGIFVVSKRMATDIHDYIDDDSSLELSSKNPIGKSSIYMTPEKKKKYRYYS